MTNHYEMVLAAMVAEAKVDGRQAGAESPARQPRLLDGRLRRLDRVACRVFDDHPASAERLDDLAAEARVRVA